MNEHEILTIILSILIPTLSGLGWMIIRVFKMTKEISEMKIEILKEIRTLDSRISHIEGYLIGAAQKTGTGGK